MEEIIANPTGRLPPPPHTVLVKGERTADERY